MKTLPKVQMAGLVVFIILLVVAGIAAILGSNIVSNIGTEFADCNATFTLNESNNLCENSTGTTYHPSIYGENEWNASVFARQGISNLSEQFPNIGLVVAAVVIIGLLVAGFAFAFRGRGGNVV